MDTMSKGNPSPMPMLTTLEKPQSMNLLSATSQSEKSRQNAHDSPITHLRDFSLNLVKII